ncbi:hypothetical protein Bca52824_015736 [Brassica carinata]|uniref:Uncharacterized protein n=1 Tax=Brassica carinata TaxID=52824 RepID=A0A8X8B5N7_BRACI|nr:hypothetical protein Bca52824_015736 [Brassica carinata]
MWFAGGGGGGLRKLCRAGAAGLENEMSSNSLLVRYMSRERAVNVRKINPKEAGVSGINSKTHMKLLLKWMRGRKMLKLICNQVGSSKKFFHTILPEDPQQETPHVAAAAATENKKQNFKRRSK